MSRYRDGLTLGEGPRWNDGALWVSDPQKGGIWTDSGGTWAFTPLTAQSNGLWFLPGGRLAGAIMREKRVGLWDGAASGRTPTCPTSPRAPWETWSATATAVFMSAMSATPPTSVNSRGRAA